MLYPAMSELLKKVGNRYKLVNVAAKRARDIAQSYEEAEESFFRKVPDLNVREVVHRNGAAVFQFGR